MRIFGIFLVIALWLLLGFKMCSDYTSCCSGSEEVVGVAENSAVAVSTTDICQNGLICFADDSCTPQLGRGWQAYKDSLVSLIDNGVQLQITGIYNGDESYDGSANDLGYCRAEALKGLLGDIDPQLVLTSGYATVGSDVGPNERYLVKVADSSEASEGTSTGTVMRSAVIYFPYNSTNKLNDDEIEDYLRDVASSIKSEGGTVLLIGHTDDKGREIKNMELGQRRANVIMDYLLGQGLLRSQIRAESKGESDPVATNATAVGRAKNRRVELKIIR